jgi:hypothetical protein
LAEIGLPGQQMSILDGGDVDTATGRLLTVAELQAALVAAQAVAAARASTRSCLTMPSTAVMPSAPAVATSAAEDTGTSYQRTEPDEHVEPDDETAQLEHTERAGRSRWWSPRRRGGAPSDGPLEPAGDVAASVAGSAAPAGFTGAAAVRAWSWLTDAAPPRVLVCGAGGGVGATTVVAVLAGLLAAARPDRVLAVEVARRDFSPLTRQVCGPVDAVSVGSWLAPGGDRVPDLKVLPAGPSGARVVQAGAQWWPRLTGQVPAGTAVVADLGSLEHPDTRELLLGHTGPAVMVARADSAGATAALAALTELDAAGLTRRPVLVLCDAAGSRPGVLRTAQRLAATAADVLVLPKAPALRRGPVPIGGWDRGLSAAVADLVCALTRTDSTPPPDRRALPLADPDIDTTGAAAKATAEPDPGRTTDKELT